MQLDGVEKMPQRLGFLMIALVLLVFSGASTVRANPVVFNFNSPTGELANSQAYIAGSITLTVFGFNGVTTGTATHLFGKNNSGDELGVGINGARDNEITSQNFVQLDLSTWATLDRTTFEMQMGSTTSGEMYNIYGSNTLGMRGTLLGCANCSGGTTEAFFSVNPGGLRYVTVQAIAIGGDCGGGDENGVRNTTPTTTAPCGNVLLRSVRGSNSTVPEPASMLLLGTGLIGAAAGFRRRRKIKR